MNAPQLSKQLSISALLAYALLTTTAFAADVTDKRGAGWRMTNINLDVILDPENERMEVSGSLRLKLTTESTRVSTIAITHRADFMRFVELQAPTGATATIDAERPSRVAIEFEEPKKKGDEFELSFSYESVEKHLSQLVLDSPDVVIGSWTESWYPRPGNKPAALAWQNMQTVPGTVTIHMPTGWSSLATGKRISREESNDEVVEVWHADRALAWSFVAGPYNVSTHIYDGHEIVLYLLSDGFKNPEEKVRALASALTAQEERFGPYPYATYGIAEVPDGITDWSASSHQGFIMSNSSNFNVKDGNLVLFAHEMAHSWWGNLVSNTGPGGKLLSESLAQYGAVVALEALLGEDAATDFLRFSRVGYNQMQCARGYFRIWRVGGDKALVKLAGDQHDHNLSDSKGNWVYHMLRRRVGDEVFFDTLQQIVRDFSAKALTVKELRKRFVEAAPDANLERFFEQWLDQPGAPILDIEWSDVEGQDNQIELTITQRDEPYHLFVEVKVNSFFGSRLHTVEISQPETTVTLDAPGPAEAVQLDPNHRLLIWTPKYGKKPKPLRTPQ